MGKQYILADADLRHSRSQPRLRLGWREHFEVKHRQIKLQSHGEAAGGEAACGARSQDETGQGESARRKDHKQFEAMDTED